MAGYGCARTYAEMLGDRQGAQLLQTTLTEESETDKKLTKLAKSVINVAAKSFEIKQDRQPSQPRNNTPTLGAIKRITYETNLIGFSFYRGIWPNGIGCGREEGVAR